PRTRMAVPHLDIDANELALVYRARGMAPEDAEAKAAQVLGEHHLYEGSTAGVEVSGDQHEAVGTGLRAGLSSFCFFASGALVPVLPYLFGLSGLVAVAVAAGLVGTALLVTGAVVGLLSGAPPLRRAVRQLLI